MTDTMRAAVYRRPGQLEVADTPVPALGPRDALVEVAYCGVCGTDLHMVLDGWGTPDTVFGHEWAGRVAAVGAEAEARIDVRHAGRGSAVDRVRPLRVRAWPSVRRCAPGGPPGRRRRLPLRRLRPLPGRRPPQPHRRARRAQPETRRLRRAAGSGHARHNPRRRAARRAGHGVRLRADRRGRAAAVLVSRDNRRDRRRGPRSAAEPWPAGWAPTSACPRTWKRPAIRARSPLTPSAGCSRRPGHARPAPSRARPARPRRHDGAGGNGPGLSEARHQAG